jgi:hypothetical protein
MLDCRAAIGADRMLELAEEWRDWPGRVPVD